MKNIGMIGLGKLGLPCALAMAQHGKYNLFGYEIQESLRTQISKKNVTFWEAGVNEYLNSTNLELVDSCEQIVLNCEIIFLAVPTPHDAQFEGLTPMPAERRDFDYSYLISAMNEIALNLKKFPDKNPLIVVISTVLPGTMRSIVFPILNEARPDFRFAYNPYFIAMGTTIQDFLNPEFILIGAENEKDLHVLSEFYSFLNSEVMGMSIESAELTKVAYNTFIGFKIIFANAIAEIVDARGGNVDEVTNAIGKAKYRLMSPKYLSAGMGDGGGCHPRDQIAMSWLATESGMSVDIFEFIARARDKQTKRQSDLILKYCKEYKLKALILGKAYKENSPLTVGSPALLLSHYLKESGQEFSNFDPWVDSNELNLEEPVVAFIATKHDVFQNYQLPNGSVVIDPWGYFKSVTPDTVVISPGREKR